MMASGLPDVPVHHPLPGAMRINGISRATSAWLARTRRTTRTPGRGCIWPRF